MSSPKRYYNLFRHKVSGRADRRLLNRAVSCGLCGGPLGADRWLYRAYFTHMACDLLACHTACGDGEPERIEERRQAGEAQRAAWSARWAAEQRARSRLIVVDFGAPP